jgi:hypothetical protein
MKYFTLHNVLLCLGLTRVQVQMVQDPLEKALFSFCGRPGGPQGAAWQLRPRLPTQSDAAPRVPVDHPTFSQHVSLSGALLATQLKLFGRIFPLVGFPLQNGLIESLTAALAADPSVGNSKAARKSAALSPRTPCVCACALTALSAVARTRKASAHHSLELAVACKDLGLALLSAGPCAVRTGGHVTNLLTSLRRQECMMCAPSVTALHCVLHL